MGVSFCGGGQNNPRERRFAARIHESHNTKRAGGITPPLQISFHPNTGAVFPALSADFGEHRLAAASEREHISRREFGGRFEAWGVVDLYQPRRNMRSRCGTGEVERPGQYRVQAQTADGKRNSFPLTFRDGHLARRDFRHLHTVSADVGEFPRYMCRYAWETIEAGGLARGVDITQRPTLQAEAEQTAQHVPMTGCTEAAADAESRDVFGRVEVLRRQIIRQEKRNPPLAIRPAAV